MSTPKISARNTGVILAVMIMCSLVMSGSLTSRQNTWMAFAGMLLTHLPLTLVICRTVDLFHGKNLFEIIVRVFPKLPARLIIGALTIYFVLVTALVTRNFVEFAVVIALKRTPRVVLIIALASVALYAGSKGISLIGRWSVIAAVIILLNLIFSIIVSLDIMDVSQMLPMNKVPVPVILQNSYMIGTIAVGDTILMLSCVASLREGDSPYAAYLSGLAAGVFVTTTIVLRNLLILGQSLVKSAKFASYMAMRIIKRGNFMERIESLVSFNLFMMCITKLSVSICASARGFAQLVRDDRPDTLTPAVFLPSVAIAALCFQSMQDMFDFAWGYRFFAIPFQVLIPLAVWIKAEIYCRKNTHGPDADELAPESANA